MKNEKVNELKTLIVDFQIPSCDYFSECMRIAQHNKDLYYKGGVFICDQDSVKNYASMSEFWARSFFALIENIGLGDLFHKVIPLLRWDNIASDIFVDEYAGLLKESVIENIAGDDGAEKEMTAQMDAKNISGAVKVLNDSIISSVARLNGGYVSYFIMADDVGLRNGWRK
ncbi:hypothetical protein [Micavibrio aeruginosavorus]|uniref:hypothetical protein n=1 Tax=Micavibrio aeruginosavorus TaxID=349221 RepID=UPI003F4AC7E3